MDTGIGAETCSIMGTGLGMGEMVEGHRTHRTQMKT